VGEASVVFCDDDNSLSRGEHLAVGSNPRCSHSFPPPLQHFPKVAFISDMGHTLKYTFTNLFTFKMRCPIIRENLINVIIKSQHFTEGRTVIFLKSETKAKVFSTTYILLLKQLAFLLPARTDKWCCREIYT